MTVKDVSNIDINKLFISALGDSKRFEFGSYVHLPFMNQIFQYRQAQVILLKAGEVNIFSTVLYISTLEHARMLILST